MIRRFSWFGGTLDFIRVGGRALIHLYHIMFLYLKKHHNVRVVFDPSFLEINEKDFLRRNRMKHYRDVKEDLPPNVPEALCVEIILRAFVDSDHAGDKLTRWSRTGFLAYLNSTPIYWLSKLQASVAKSTVDSEYRSMSNLTDTILWLRSFLRELSKPQLSPTPILTDSRGALLACYNSIGQKKIRHLEIHLHSIRERTNNFKSCQSGSLAGCKLQTSS